MSESTDQPTPSMPINQPASDDPREQRYQAVLSIVMHAREMQGGYGKWLLASLLAAHTGAIIAITQAGDLSAPLFRASGPYLVWGIVVTLVAGGFTWINYSAAIHFYMQNLNDVRMGKEPSNDGVSWWIGQAIFFTVPFVAIGSLVLLALAAHSALQEFDLAQSPQMPIPQWLHDFARFARIVGGNR